MRHARARWSHPQLRDGAHDSASEAGDERPAPAAVGSRVAGVIAVAMVLLVTSGLMDRMQSIEGVGGMWLLNILFATPIAIVVVSGAALLAAALLDRKPNLPTPRLALALLAPALALGGGSVGAAIVISHSSRPIDLASWISLGGSVLLILAAVAQHIQAGSR